MDLLLDTHTFLWFSENNSKLSERAKTEIEQTSNTIFISIATLWEIGIKLSSRKLELIRSFEEMINLTYESGIELLPITEKHILEVSRLPFHHRDPFDRLLIAQALTENMSIVSNEKSFDAYKVKRIW